MNFNISFFKFKRSLSGFLFPVIVSLLTLYFLYHAVQSDRGIFAYVTLRNKLHHAMIVVEHADKIKTDLSQENKRLSEDSLDLDLLEELAKRNLNLTSEDEVVIFDKETNTIKKHKRPEQQN